MFKSYNIHTLIDTLPTLRPLFDTLILFTTFNDTTLLTFKYVDKVMKYTTTLDFIEYGVCTYLIFRNHRIVYAMYTFMKANKINDNYSKT